MSSYRTFRVTVAGVVAIGIAVLSAVALAQDLTGFDVQQFNPMPSQHTNHFSVSSGHVLRSGAFELGVFANYADDPLVIETSDGDRVESVVASQLAVNFLGAVGLFDFIELGFDIPLIALQDGDTISDVRQLVDRPEPEFGLGDIRIIPKFRLVTTDTMEEPGGFTLALLADIHLPTGDPDIFQGEDFRIEPRLALDVSWPKGERFSFNVGYLIRTTEAELSNAEVGSAITYGVGLTIPLGTKVVQFVPEVFGEVNPAADDIDVEELPLEILLGLKIFPADWLLIQLGGGTGLVSGYGTPDWRAFLGLSYAFWPNLDRDGDGLLNRNDSCPDDPEDFDGFEDYDGCPDLDNDQDGIPDARDECPNEPEDLDGFEDENGCPDPDNDGDGIRDARDECPDNPEDFDGFEDENGCPDPDNDGDGICDPWVSQQSLSVAYAEVCRGTDRCPDEPENFNDFEDEDGCYDEALVTITCEAVVIHDMVYFDTNSDRIQPRSYDLLDQVYRVIDHHPDLRVIEIQGHTDDRGRDAYNLDLSERRAASVRAYLIERGVDPARLLSRGYGETTPIVPNDSAENRSLNRRVEFIILEQEGCQEEQ
ncbi:MAG: OmpA family protein [Bradymonadales bacterium]|nr:OmpA family protein [Bradymonadales bacterium]